MCPHDLLRCPHLFPVHVHARASSGNCCILKGIDRLYLAKNKIKYIKIIIAGEQHGATWGNMEQHGATWGNMGQHGATWSNMGQHGATGSERWAFFCIGRCLHSLDQISLPIYCTCYIKLHIWSPYINPNPYIHTHTHTYIYIYMCVCISEVYKDTKITQLSSGKKIKQPQKYLGGFQNGKFATHKFEVNYENAI